MEKVRYYVEVFKAFVYMANNHGMVITLILFVMGGGKC